MSQTQDQPAPTNDTPAAPAPDGNTSGATPQAETPTVTMTQEELNAKFGKTRDEGRLSLAKQYGFDNVEAFDSAMKAFQAKAESEMSEVDRLKEKEKTLSARERELAKENRTLKVNSAAERIALELDTDPKKLAAVLKLREEGGELDADGNLNAKAIKDSIKAVLADNPYFKRGGAQTTVGGGGNPAGAAATSLTLDQQIAQANKEGRFMDAIRLQTQKLYAK